MLFNRADDYFGKFNMYWEKFCYKEKILQICLNMLELHGLRVIYQQMI